MTRFSLALVVWLVLGASWAAAQSSPPPPAPNTPKAPENGVVCAAVPEVLYDQLPKLQRGQGVVVELVQADSLAHKAGLRRHDIVLTCDGEQVRDGAQFFRLIRHAKPDQKVPLVVLRAGQEVTLHVNWLPVKTQAEGDLTNLERRGWTKPGGPPAVNVTATPLRDGKMAITFAYFVEGSGKLQSVTCSGSLAEIEREINTSSRLPSDVRILADVALKRIRVYSAR
jgi:hypothetical protein